MINLILLHWKTVTVVLYSLASFRLCYILKNRLKDEVMQDTVLGGRSTSRGRRKGALPSEGLCGGSYSDLCFAAVS